MAFSFYKITAILRSEEDNIEFTMRLGILNENKGITITFIRKNVLFTFNKLFIKGFWFILKGDIFKFYEMVRLLRIALQNDLKTLKK